MARRAPTVPYLSSFNYLQPVLAQRPHLERGGRHRETHFCRRHLEERTAFASERTDRGSGLKLLLPATRVITKNILAPLAIALRLNPGFRPSATQTRPITGP